MCVQTSEYIQTKTYMKLQVGRAVKGVAHKIRQTQIIAVVWFPEVEISPLFRF